MAFVDAYELISDDYNLSDSNKLQVSHKIPQDDAKIFFNHKKRYMEFCGRNRDDRKKIELIGPTEWS